MADERGRLRPRYQQVADELRAAIASGKYRVGERLPALPELADEYDVAKNTADHALSVLRAEGLVETVHGTGTWVIEPKGPAEDFAAMMKRLDDLTVEVRLLRAEVAEVKAGQRSDP